MSGWTRGALAMGAALAWAGAAAAEVPKVATDIAPVHALVAQVMGDLGAPSLIVRQGASPHGYALRPSEARAVQEADLVVWMGPALTPWLEGPLDALSGDARMLTLLAVPDVVTLSLREGHDHDDDHGHEEASHDHDHDHEEASHDHDHGHDHDEASHGHDDHGHGHEEASHDHGAGGTDPHAWLDPVNAQLWLETIAAELSALDPGNAETYAANAAEGQAAIAATIEDIRAKLAPMQGVPFVVFHDAYRYFEDRFGLTFAGSVKGGDAADASPAQLRELEERIEAQGVRCAFREPQFDDRLLRVAAGDRLHYGELDPMGADLTLGADFYPALLRQMARGFAGCVAQG